MRGSVRANKSGERLYSSDDETVSYCTKDLAIDRGSRATNGKSSPIDRDCIGISALGDCGVLAIRIGDNSLSYGTSS